MTDVVFKAFLISQWQAGVRLAQQSDVLELSPLFDQRPPDPPYRYVAKFSCTGALRDDEGRITPRQAEFIVGIVFPPDYLRRVDPGQIITWLEPASIQHPNVAPPYLCAGHIPPGMALVDLLYQIYEIIIYENWAAHDALNADASVWALAHQHLFPLDRKPLKRRTLNLNVAPLADQNGKGHEV